MKYKFKVTRNSFVLFIAFIFVIILMSVSVIGSQQNKENRSKAAHPDDCQCVNEILVGDNCGNAGAQCYTAPSETPVPQPTNTPPPQCGAFNPCGDCGTRGCGGNDVPHCDSCGNVDCRFAPRCGNPLTNTPTPTLISTEDSPTPTQPMVGVNLALNKPARAKSEESAARSAAKANDGQVNTLWIAKNGDSGNWWQVDLGANYKLETADVVFEDSQSVWKYKVRVSKDGDNWETVADKTNNTDKSQTQTLQLAHAGGSVTGRYVRVTFTQTPAGRWTALAEFRVFGAGLAPNTPTPTNTTDCSATKTSGDANCDGKISGLDYVIWLNIQCNPEGSQTCQDFRADFSNPPDKKVNNDDYQIWYDNSR